MLMRKMVIGIILLSNFLLFHKIKALRQMGFTIDEITLIIKGIKATEIFENRKKD